MHLQSPSPSNEKNVSVVWDVYEATKDADGVYLFGKPLHPRV
jgi:UDPglucose 6-dehydrogenase